MSSRILHALLSGAVALSVSADEARQIPVTEGSFGCLTEMTPVRGFYVANLLGRLEDTLKVANSPTGGRYPPGSVVQLVPTEVMVKHHEGWNPATNDWEFFELDVSEGPIERSFGLATLVIHTAGTEQAAVSLGGLARDTAFRVRDWLIGGGEDDAV